MMPRYKPAYPAYHTKGEENLGLFVYCEILLRKS